jgi:hypothetical protein
VRDVDPTAGRPGAGTYAYGDAYAHPYIITFPNPDAHTYTDAYANTDAWVARCGQHRCTNRDGTDCVHG